MELGPTTTPVNELAYLAPRRFRRCIAAEVKTAHVEWLDYNYSAKFPVPRKGVRAEGIRFERKVLEELSALYPGFVSSLPLRYYTPVGEMRTCIPDGLLFLPDGSLVVVEIKLSHTMAAWFQLSNVYAPVARRATGMPVRLLEVVKSFNPELRFPVPISVHVSVSSYISSLSPFGVCVWR